jgi:hypothetical protein
VTRHVLIDNDGEFHVTIGDWRAALGEPGPAQVRIPRTGDYPMMSGWVNDIGHQLGLPRNICGGLVLTGMGAAVMPYAGPVVFTGWTPHGQPTEVCDLTNLQIAVLSDTYEDARRALAGDDGLGFPDARRIAEQMRTAPAPTVTVEFGDVAHLLDQMRGRS